MSLVSCLKFGDNSKVCSTAASCEEALQAAKLFQPELIILDLRLPDCEIIELIPRLRTLCPHSPILAIGLGADSRSAKAALDAGARAFLHKDSLRHSLHQTVEALLTNTTPAI